MLECLHKEVDFTACHTCAILQDGVLVPYFILSSIFSQQRENKAEMANDKLRKLTLTSSTLVMVYLVALKSYRSDILNVLPFLLLIWLGCFCLAKLGYDLLTFNDYTLKTAELEQVHHFLNLLMHHS